MSFRGRIGIALLLAVCSIGPLSTAYGQQGPQQGCEIDEAQKLFGQQPRPDATIEPLLKACVAAGATDYRVYMFLGVMARDAGDRERAIGYLRKAHELDPAAPNPALELGFTLEAAHGDEAAKVYDEILVRDPNNRPALLGLARVDRGQNRLEKARAIYERLVAANPNDPDALNGLAWLQLADRNRVEGTKGFEHVLVLDPNNAEAKIGLAKAKDVYRYTFDTNGLLVTTATGTSWGFGATALLGLTAFDTLELGETHFGNEIQTLTAVGVATLPSDDIRIGWNRLVPLTYASSLTYDYRGHKSLPTEHWLDAGLTLYLTDYLRWVATLVVTHLQTPQFMRQVVKCRIDGILFRPLTAEEFIEQILLLAKAVRVNRQRQQKRVLAIGAHPDDVEIGCGGTLARHRAKGDMLNILTLSRGAAGGDVNVRATEAYKAADILGATLQLGSLRDAHISEGVATIAIIEAAIRELQPTHVYTHCAEDTHQDHRAVHAASLVAARNVPNLYCYQSPSSTVEFRPRRFVDITHFIGQKIKVIDAYHSQVDRMESIQSDVIVATARYWGRFAGYVLAEPLKVIRERDGDLPPGVGKEGALPEAAAEEEEG